MAEPNTKPTRELLVHQLYEAAELEHDLMCTYLYAAFSLRDGEAEGLTQSQASAVARWRSTILRVAVEEMGHLTAVWNITAGLGATPHFGRDNFPLSAGYLPAGVVVKLAPFNAEVLQHFVHLERPEGSSEPDGADFTPLEYKRGTTRTSLTPMGTDYDTVGTFYATLGARLRSFVSELGEGAAFCGDPALQLSAREVALLGAKPVRCLKTALDAFAAIVRQGEGAPEDAVDSHFQRFVAVRSELAELQALDPDFQPAFPASVNPVLRPPMDPRGRVWIEDPEAFAVVDLANSSYALMLRLISYTYGIPSPDPEKALAVDLSLALMRAVTLLGEQAARMPAGPSHPHCNAGMSFTTLRAAAPLPRGASSRRFFVERLTQLADAAQRLVQTPRTESAARQLAALVARAEHGFAALGAAPPPVAPPAPVPAAAPEARFIEGSVERVEGQKLSLLFEAKRCIHARFCVTGAPRVFLANVEGPWIHPDAMPVDRLVEIAHACPSGAIRYRRKDGQPDEAAPPVNLVATREAGPYAVRGDIRLDGAAIGYRATLCRCGASKNKPYCDGSHHDVQFAASGEPPTGTSTEMLAVRDGPLAIDPEPDGPLAVRGNLEITSGTGRMVARLESCRLCRCGGSQNKPYCDGSHVRIGFKSL